MSFTTGGESGGGPVGRPQFGSQSFGAPAHFAELTEMFRSLIRKSYQQPPDTAGTAPRITSLSVNFDGGGQPLVIGMSGIPQMPAGAYRIIGCHMAAGIWDPVSLTLRPAQVSAQVDIRLASLGLWPGGSVPIWGGTIPHLQNQSEVDMDITDWAIVNLQPFDQIVFSLVSISGTLTTITTTLSLRQLDVVGIGVNPMTDDDPEATEFTDDDGFAFETRE